MATTVISATYPPHIDVTKAPLAYGDRALPRLNRELHDENLLTRQRAVNSLCEYLHDPENIVAALREGIVQSLKEILSDPDPTLRIKTTECLYIIATHAVGREAFISQGIITPLSKLFNDPEDMVRKNAHKALQICTEAPDGSEGLVDAGLVPVLVKKLVDEHDDMKEHILDSLHFAMRHDTAKALASDAMEVFTNLLKHESPSIRGKAARDIMDLSVTLAGKDKAVEVMAIPRLVQLLEDEDTDVRSNAAGGLMMITITTKGKYTALEAGCIKPLVALVDDPNSEVRANCLKALTCVAEAPEGRESLQEHMDKLKLRQSDNVPAVVKAAKICVDQVAWTP